MLRTRKQSLRKISEAAGVNYWWLAKFAQGKFEDSGATKVQKVHDYLSSELNGQGASHSA
jgi:hypothetical protein